MLKGVVVGLDWVGAAGDRSRRVRVEIFLCTVEGCSEPPQQSTLFHGSQIKAGGEKNAGEVSLLTVCSYRFNPAVIKWPR